MSQQTMEGLSGMRVGELLESLAAKTPAPGGGAAACVVGAIGVALAGMVLSYSVGRKVRSEHEGLLLTAQERLAALRARLMELGDADAAAYATLNAMMRKDANPGPGMLAEASRACTQIPMDALGVAAEAIDVMVTLAQTTNPHLRSDLRVAVQTARAAAQGCAENVRANLGTLGTHAGEAEARIARERCDRVLASAVLAAEGLERATSDGIQG
jgi:formiminotetrahydrofolate cyclodeaminase